MHFERISPVHLQAATMSAVVLDITGTFELSPSARPDADAADAGGGYRSSPASPAQWQQHEQNSSAVSSQANSPAGAAPATTPQQGEYIAASSPYTVVVLSN